MNHLREEVQRLSTDSAALIAIAAGAGLSLLLWTINDYRAWISFGTGGTPPNIKGYLRITNFRIKRFLTFDNLKDSSRLSESGRRFINTPFIKREGQPPKIVSRTLPQRQIPEPLAAEVSIRLHDLPRSYTTRYPELLVLNKSISEGHTTDAIYARTNIASRKDGAQDPLLGDEIAHVHPTENSLHVWLTEADCKTVVAAGWGERFPLASLGMIDQGWTFLYAPRTMQHIEVIEEIIRAGIQNVTGTTLPV